MKSSQLKIAILTSLLLLFFLFPTYAVKKIEANPINIAVMLTQETDTARIDSTLRYYGYTSVSNTARSADTATQSPTLQAPLADTDGFNVFSHPNGSEIRYKFTNADHKYPTIEVTSKVSSKDKDKTLKNLNFQKKGNAYVRKSVGYTTRCTTGSHGSLILTSQPSLRP